MDTSKAFEHNGIYEIPNPNYKKGSKKQPKTIQTDNFFKTSGVNVSPEVSMFNKAALDTWQMQDTQKYHELGITPNKISNLTNELARTQSVGKKWLNAAGQTLISEITLGTAKGFSDLVDLIGQSVGLSDKDYTNPVSQYLEQKQEEFRNWAPIYTYEDVNITNGGLLDGSWWASNIPSIASALTLLIPSTGIVKGLSYLGKLKNVSSVSRIGNKIATNVAKYEKGRTALSVINNPKHVRLTKLAAANGTNAVLQRTMENYQEARGVYNDMYNEARESLNNMSEEEYSIWIKNNENKLEDVDVSNRNEVAKAIARNSADEDFRNNYINTIFDVIQMYSLKNNIGGNILKGIGRGASNKAQREALEEVAKSVGQTVQQGAKKKAKDYIKDNFIGAKFLIAGQLSEGVEEAINTISQFEAMDTGRQLLGTSNYSSFDDRLESYAKSPQLWESMFWGVMGGVVFQYGGDKLNRIAYNVKNKNNTNKPDNTTGESTQAPNWSLTGELPEVKRKIAEIQNRKVRLDNLSQKLAMIKQHKNPFDENGTTLTDSEAEILEESVRNQAFTNIILEAMNNGNSDMLREYLADDNVRTMMVQLGIINENDSKNFQQEVIENIDKIEKEYYDDLSNLSILAGHVRTEQGSIPIELLQKIATDNVYKRRDAKFLADKAEEAKAEYSNLLQKLTEYGYNIDTSVYESVLTSKANFHGLKKLYEAKQQLEIENEKNPSIGTQLSLENVNAEIKEFEKEMLDINSEQSIAKFLFVKNANAIQATATNNLTDKQKAELENEYKEIDEAITTKDFSKLNKKYGLKDSTVEEIDNIINQIKLESENLQKVTDEINVLTEASSKNSDIFSDYSVEKGELIKAFNEAYEYKWLAKRKRSQIVNTVDALKRDVTITNNTLSEMRQNKLKESTKTFETMLEKYGRTSVESAIAYRRIGDDSSYEAAIEHYSEEDKKAIDEAITVFNFANPANINLYSNLSAILDLKEIVLEQKKMQKEKNSTTNQNQSETVETNKTINTSSNGTESHTEEKISQNSQQQEQNQAQSETNITQSLNNEQQQDDDVTTNIRLTPEGNLDNTGSINVTAVKNENGTYELQINKSEVPESVLENNKLFDIGKEVSFIDNNFAVKRNPIIEIKEDGSFEIISKGFIDKQSIIENSNSNNNSTPVEGFVANDTISSNNNGIIDSTISNLENGQAQDIVSNFKTYKGIVYKGNINGKHYTGKFVTTDNQRIFVYYTDDAPSSPIYITTLNTEQEEWLKTKLIKQENKSDKSTTNPSTGRLIETDDTIIGSADSSILKDPKLVINSDVIDVIKHFMSGTSKFTMDDVIKHLYDKYKDTGIEESVLTDIINNIRSNRLFNKLITESNKKLDAIISVQDAQHKMSSIDEDKDGNKKRTIDDIYAKAADKLFGEYLSDRNGIIRINSDGNEKIYFSFQDLLAWCNEVTSTHDTAASIYGYLKQYILEKSKDKDYLYRIVDEAALNADELFDNNNALVKNDDFNSSLSHRVPIQQLLDIYIKDENKKAYKRLIKVIDNLKRGDELNFNRSINSIDIYKNNFFIGSLPIPKVSNVIVDTYEVKNDNWMYDINASDGSSILKEIFKSWIREETPAGKEINDIIYALSFDNLDESQKGTLYKRFINNAEIIRLVNKGIIKGEQDVIMEEDLIKAAKGLVKLYKYIAKTQSKISGTEYEYKLADVLSNSIDDFFDKLLDSYKTIDLISKNPENYTMKVSSITSGKLTKQVEDTGQYLNPEVEKQANTVKDCVAKSLIDRFEFGFIPNGYNAYGNKTSGIIYGTNGSRVDFPGTPGNTFGMITDQNGIPQVVRAFPVKFNDDRLSNDARLIQQAIKDEITNLVEDFANHKSGSYEVLREFLNNTFNNKDRSVSRGFLSDSDIIIRDMNGKGFNIAIEGQPYSVFITNNTFKGKIQYQISIKNGGQNGQFVSDGSNRQEAINMLHAFVDRSGIGIHFDAMNNTLNETYALSGFMSRNNKGEFVVTIPNSKTGKPIIVSDKSYKDFLINNNLVKINLKKVKDVDGKETNFIRKDNDNQIGNQTLRVKFERKQDSDINKESAKRLESVSERRVEKAIDILTSTNKRTHKGNEIAKLILGNEISNLLKPIKGYSILPKNIIFDERLNSKDGFQHVNAVFNNKTKTIIVGTKWIDMLKNPETKLEAIRKLIHEQLHYILSIDGNEKYIEQIRSIREEFIAANEQDGIPKDLSIRRYENIHENERINLEEFLVESLTSKELITRLNEINAKDIDKKTKSKSLFQKIVEVMANMFGWNVRKGSLYEKEFRLLADIIQPIETINDVQSENEVKDDTETINSDSTSINSTNDTTINDSNDFDNEFSDDIDFDDIMRSSINEDIQVPTIRSFIESLSSEYKATIREQIDNGEISTHCR